jgi:DnaJ domain
MLDGLDLDPHTILGVSRGASAADVRDAYREKSKKHHPDLGGDEWAFRLVAKAYEILSTTASFHASLKTATPDTGRVRAGIHDKQILPSRIAAVEMVWVRYEVDDVMTLMADRSENRGLSGSLTITWPDPNLGGVLPVALPTDRVLKALNGAVDEVTRRTSPLSSKSQINDGKFEAWLSYPNGNLAWAAFKVMHVDLKARGLGVRQWTRDITIPREGQ